MSHSDSEIRDDFKDKIRKQLKLEFKAKKRCSTPADVLALKKRLRPLYKEYRLVQAVNTHNIEQVKELLSVGVNPNSTDNEMRGALHVAVSKG